MRFERKKVKSVQNQTKLKRVIGTQLKTVFIIKVRIVHVNRYTYLYILIIYSYTVYLRSFQERASRT